MTRLALLRASASACETRVISSSPEYPEGTSAATPPPAPGVTARGALGSGGKYSSIRYSNLSRMFIHYIYNIKITQELFLHSK